MQLTSSLTKRRKLSPNATTPFEAKSGSLQESYGNGTKIDLSHKLQETAFQATRLLDEQLSRLKACQGSGRDRTFVPSSWETITWSPYGRDSIPPFDDQLPSTSCNTEGSFGKVRLAQSAMARIRSDTKFSTTQILRASPPLETPAVIETDTVQHARDEPLASIAGTRRNLQRTHTVERFRRPSPIFSDDDIPIIPFTTSKHRIFDYPDDIPNLTLTPRQLVLELPLRREFRSKSSTIETRKQRKSNVTLDTKSSLIKRHQASIAVPNRTNLTSSEYAVSDVGKTEITVQKDGTLSLAKPLEAQNILTRESNEAVLVNEPEATVEPDYNLFVRTINNKNAPGESQVPAADYGSTTKHEVREALEALRERWPPLIQDVLRQSSVTLQTKSETSDQVSAMRDAQTEVVPPTDRGSLAGVETGVRANSDSLSVSTNTEESVDAIIHEDVVHHEMRKISQCNDEVIGRGPSSRHISQTTGMLSSHPKPSTPVTWNTAVSMNDLEKSLVNSKTTQSVVPEASKWHGTNELADSLKGSISRNTAYTANEEHSSLSQLPLDSKSARCDSPDAITVDQGVYASPVSHSKPLNRDTFVKTPRKPKTDLPTPRFKIFVHSHPGPSETPTRASSRRGTPVIQAKGAQLNKKLPRAKPSAPEHIRGTPRQRRSPSSSPDPLAV